MTTYIDSKPQHGWLGTVRFNLDDGHDWRLFTLERLRWQYGVDRAARIVTGNDPATQADLAAWRRLGNPRDAA